MWIYFWFYLNWDGTSLLISHSDIIHAKWKWEQKCVATPFQSRITDGSNEPPNNHKQLKPRHTKKHHRFFHLNSKFETNFINFAPTFRTSESTIFWSVIRFNSSSISLDTPNPKHTNIWLDATKKCCVSNVQRTNKWILMWCR